MSEIRRLAGRLRSFRTSRRRFTLLSGSLLLLGLLRRTGLAQPATGLAKSPPGSRLVGIAYAAWFDKPKWNETWSAPTLGQYVSTDLDVIRQHAEWLSSANVDFIYLDWSNDLNTGVAGSTGQSRQVFIERATGVIFDQYAKLPRHPRIAIMIGFPGDKAGVSDGRLRRKADQVWEAFASNPTCQQVYQHHLGHPLLLVYTGTPSPFAGGLPPWSDPRFTVRFMTGFLSQQPSLLAPGGVSRFGYWSWEDRGPPILAGFQGAAEAMTVVPAWRGDTANSLPAQGRDGGRIYADGWARARQLGPRIVLAGTFNEWSNPREEPSAEVSKDIEPSQAFGTKYLDLLRAQASAFKSGAP